MADELSLEDELEVVDELSDSGAGSMLRSVLQYFVSGSPRILKQAFCPGLTFMTSASLTSASTVTVSTSAIFRIVGALWFDTTVCPSSVTMAITMPSIGAVILV